MPNEVETFVKDFKATKKRLNELSPKEGEKIKKAMVANLEKTWDAEDAMKEAVIEARTAGVPGKKSAPFLKHAKVTKPFKTWQAALKIYHADLDKLEAFTKEAKELNAELTKRVTTVEKDLKKGGGTADIPTMATIKEAKRALPELKKAENILGSTKSFMVMYGLNMQRTVDAIVKQAVDSVTPKEFPEPLADANRAKTEKTVDGHSKKIKSACDGAKSALEEDKIKVAEKLIKDAEKLLETLAGFEKEAKLTKTKMKDEVKADEKSKKLQALMKKIGMGYKTAAGQVDEVQKELKEKTKAAR
ncbi:hypothetical protein Z945_3353 [Sulfitobacter noctilucae]|uniref:hypothetical protein n=1 Tax=Sulfitobacter noctilucae TaxID=1342302 RepID=UPI0004699958|nr:hypothetical protein [Sulfitobacter noctilucae]KIN70889.1 hypothetical protein Z945_3353 [Sulfitobacter noctilucae]